jgi:hypothetical protein
LDSDGDCCDGQRFVGRCFRSCDPIFTVCLRGSNTPHNDDSCPQQDLMISSGTGIVDRNVLTFLDTIGDIDNPIVFNVENISNATQVYIHIHDVDSGQPEELLDEIFIEVPLSSESISPLQQYSGVHGSVMMAISYRVTCSSDHYGSDCSIYCRPHNDSNNGHYTCNNITGDKECLPGYTDPTSNCIQSISMAAPTMPHLQPTQLGLPLPSSSGSSQSLTQISRLSTTPYSTVETTDAQDGGTIGAVVAVVLILLMLFIIIIIVIIVIITVRKQKFKKVHSLSTSGNLSSPQDCISGTKALENPLYGNDNKNKSVEEHTYECYEGSVPSSEMKLKKETHLEEYGTLYECPVDGVQPTEKIKDVEVSIKIDSNNGHSSQELYEELPDNSSQVYEEPLNSMNYEFDNEINKPNTLYASDYEEPKPSIAENNYYAPSEVIQIYASDIYEVPI